MMLYKREGIPEEGEVVLCTVTKVNPNSVFVNINDYDKSGLVHISEISPGRIRNIRDYVIEGKVIVCKVVRIDRERGHIDLSLRRVNETLRRNKLNEVKQEQKAEKIIELVASKYKKDFRKLYQEIALPLISEYGMLHYAFIQVANGEVKISDLKIPKEYQKEIEESIGKRFAPEQIPVGGTLKLQSYAPDGVEVVKKALKEVEKLKNVDIKYLGGGSFKIKIKTEDVKKDEKLLNQKIEEVIEFMKKNDGTGSFVKEAVEE